MTRPPFVTVPAELVELKPGEKMILVLVPGMRSVNMGILIFNQGDVNGPAII